MSTKKWAFKENVDQADVEKLGDRINIDPILTRLLLQRGIQTEDDARKFFNPDLNDLHDPFLMKGMQIAVNKIDAVIREHRPILIYGDYDVDGTTSVALLYSFLRNFYDKLEFYIPDRYEEGYGLSNQSIDWAEKQGIALIITLDCGITAVNEVEYANERNIEVIITDHHRPGEKIPAAYSILNPKQEDCPYPFKDLSGCGIGFKLAQAISQQNGISLTHLYRFLDLLAVSIASDIVPIQGENRLMAYHGLHKLSKNPVLGLKAIKEICFDPSKKNYKISDIVFKIGPRINAAGRMGDAKNAVNLLLAQNMAEAQTKALSIDNTNKERRDVDATITQQAINMLESQPNYKQLKTTVVYGENWHKGVIGIVASRLIEHYHRPTIVLSQINGVLTGSARSVKGFDIYNAIEDCSDLIDQFGGHKYAAGLTIQEENLSEFVDRFENVVSDSIQEEHLERTIEVDDLINFNSITDDFVDQLNLFAPFGPGNMQPVFRSDNVYAASPDRGVRIVGKNHLQLYVKQEGTSGFSAIGFNLGEHFNSISKGIPFNMLYTIEENEWRGKVTLKLNIKDIKI